MLARGREVLRIPLEVTVWGFTMPKVTRMHTWYQLWPMEPVQRRWRAYYRNVAEHEVSGTGGVPGRAYEGDELVKTGPAKRL